MTDSVAQKEDTVLEATQPVATDISPARGRKDGGPLAIAEAFALLGLTVLLALFFSVLPATQDTFPTAANLQVTAASQAVLVIIAIAALVPLICEEFDLSVGPLAGLTSIFCASALASGWPLPLAIALAVAIGALVGIINGLVITVGRVNSLVATLGTATILVGIVQWKTSGESIATGIPAGFIDAATEKTLGIPNSVYLAFVVAFAVYYVLKRTPFGRYLYAIGSNRTAAELVGLRVNRLVLSTFVVSGLLCGLAGVLQLGVSGTGNPRVGEGFTLPALAAAFLSVAAIKPGRYNVWGAVVAISFLAVLNSGLTLAGANTYVNNFANGLALIIGVGLASWLGHRRAHE